MTINDPYCDYSLSELLKARGFDLPCVFCYIDSETTGHSVPAVNWNEGDRISRPTLEQACSWLRDRGFEIDAYYVYSPPSSDSDGKRGKRYTWTCENVETGQDYPPHGGEAPYVGSYEEALATGVRWALENWIL